MQLIIERGNAQAFLVEPQDWAIWKDIQIQTLTEEASDEQDLIEDYKSRSAQYWMKDIEYFNYKHIVIMQDGKPAGCVNIDIADRDAMIETIDILREYQGQGLGNLAYAACVQYLKDQGYSYARVDIAPDNERSTKAALRNGFRIASAAEQNEMQTRKYIRYRQDFGDRAESLDLSSPE